MTITEEIRQELPRKMNRSPWIHLTPRKEFPANDGKNLIELICQRAEIPNISKNACVEPLKYRHTVRSYNLEQFAVRTPSFSSPEEAEQAKAIVSENICWVQENYIRDNYLRLSGNKIALDKKDIYNCSVTGCDEEFPNKVPKYPLTQGYLDAAYLELARDSAEGYYGRIDGQKQFCLIGSPEIINNLIRENSNIRQDLNFSESSEKLARLGTKWAYMGFVYLVDLQVPRYKRVGWMWNRHWQRVSFYKTEVSKNGIRTSVNPEYKKAKYEVAFIFNPEVQTIRASGVSQDFTPETDFADIVLRDDFSDGEVKQYLYCLMLQGAQPRRTEWGYSFLFKIPSSTLKSKIKAIWNKLKSRFQ